MNDILNPRVNKMIKDDLLTYAKMFGGFFAGILILVSVLSMINIGPADVDGYNFGLSLIIIMFIVGIVGGAELSVYVRQGISRIEYFKATLIGGIIASVILIPFVSLANRLINLITGSESLIYSVRYDNLLSLVMHILSFIVFFLGGYLISMIYQRFGWFVGLIITIFVLLATGVVSWNFDFWNSEAIVMFLSTLIEHDDLVGFFVPELLGPILVTVSVILASSVYALMKNTPVKIK